MVVAMPGLQEKGRRARVFISCGQAKDTDETRIAGHIAETLRASGFDPYIAVQEQTLRGVKENIFERLRESEYFLFIDFKRERLVGNRQPPTFRGSLFSHQELAIASFLSTPALVLQEDGVRTDDGILRFIQANAIGFRDRCILPDTVAREIRERGWDPDWRNELLLKRDKGEFRDARVRNLGNKLGRFFHLKVRNRHRDKTATNCYAYLRKIVSANGSVGVPLKAVEFKWAGYTMPSAHIPPQAEREFDAFCILYECPGRLRFSLFTDSSEYTPHLEGEGKP